LALNTNEFINQSKNKIYTDVVSALNLILREKAATLLHVLKLYFVSIGIVPGGGRGSKLFPIILRDWMLQYINSVGSNPVGEQKKQKQNVTGNSCERYLFLVTASYVK
jgi:hypothetical protein